MDGIDFDQAEAVIDRIADLAEAFAAAAGVGATETAGHIVSYLAEHPRDIEPCLRFGLFELPDGWYGQGRLTWMARSGKVTHPAEARRARAVKRLEKSA